MEGKVAIVTGASSGLGVAIARGLAEAGADVALGARRIDRLRETATLITGAGRRAHVVRADVGDEGDCARLVTETVQTLGRLDILVNNAGIGLVGPALRQSSADFRHVLAVNLAGCHWMACRSAEAMSDGGSIINIASISALTQYGLPQAAYAASKAGLIALTSDLAHEWTGRRKIRVNAIAPGFFVTEMTEQHQHGLEPLLARIPSGRVGQPHELSGAAIYLASEASSYMDGTDACHRRRVHDRLRHGLRSSRNDSETGLNERSARRHRVTQRPLRRPAPRVRTTPAPRCAMPWPAQRTL